MTRACVPTSWGWHVSEHLYRWTMMAARVVLRGEAVTREAACSSGDSSSPHVHPYQE